MIYAVLGALFGDEGKGQCVYSLSNKNTLNIRFSGGHQCGHNVVTERGISHIHSLYGSGTLKGADTYLSEHCTFYPVGFMNETEVIKAKCNLDMPKYYVHPFAMLTTPYDVAYNHVLEKINRHGSCGVGFGATIQRNEHHYTLFFMDMGNESVFNTKIAAIKNYYDLLLHSCAEGSHHYFNQYVSSIWDSWLESIRYVKNCQTVRTASLKNCNNGRMYEHYLFEGSQGIMLDMDVGFFPNVTRSNTTCKNALPMIQRLIESGQPDCINVYYMSRAYITRHGNGYSPSESVELINNEQETNISNEYQGVFRTHNMDFDLLHHAIDYNAVILDDVKHNDTLIFTCTDHIKNVEKFKTDYINSRLSKTFEGKTFFKNKCNWDNSI
jgi:adenylosuccinate synthase